MKSVDSYAQLESVGRQRLSPNFFMRDFLYSEIAAWHQLRNIPDFPERAIESGRRLCTELLEPLQATFGRIHIRSGYRSPLVNGFGNEQGLNCASNKSNFGAHIWDHPDEHGYYGATACIVIPWLVDYIERGGSWTAMAWWIHDHLNYNTLYFFPKLSAFNINWHEQPIRRIDSYVDPRGCLTRAGMSNHDGMHRDQYAGFPEFPTSGDPAGGKRSRSTNSPAAGESDGLPNFDAPEFPVGSNADAPINYRAVHVRTAWRKAFNHKSLDAAINGVNGAAGLFAGRARIDYDVHGEPRYVLVWATGQEKGYVLRPKPEATSELDIVTVPVGKLLEFEARGGADVSWLEQYFDQALAKGIS